MMIPDKLQQVLKNEGVVAIATQGPGGPHIVNTWHSYVKTTVDGRLIIPVGGMNKTEANVSRDSHVEATAGSRQVEGSHGPGTGFSIRGTAAFLKTGTEYDEVKQRFPWARAALEITVDSADQTL